MTDDISGQQQELFDQLVERSWAWRFTMDDDLTGNAPKSAYALLGSILLAVGGEVTFMELSFVQDKPFLLTVYGPEVFAQSAGEFLPHQGVQQRSLVVHPRNGLTRISVDLARRISGGTTMRSSFTYRGDVTVRLGLEAAADGGDQGNGTRLAEFYPQLLMNLSTGA